MPVGRLGEPAAPQQRQEVGSVEQRGAEQHQQHPVLPDLQRAEAQRPLADEAGDWRNADHAQRTDGERRHGPGHPSANAIHLADAVNPQGFGEVARTIEQRHLHQPLMHQMHQAAHRGDRSEQRDAEGHVGHLADGRVGQALLQLLLLQGAQRAVEDGGRGQPQRPGEIQPGQRFGTKDVIDHPHDTERPRLHHRHRMQQRADRRRRDHRLRQPAMQRDQRGLHPKPENQQDEGHLQRHLVLVDLLQQIAGGLEIRRAGQAVQQPHTHQHQRAAAHRIGQVDAPGGQRLRRAAVHHQREGGQGQQLVEQQKADQVARQRQAHGGADAQAEIAEEARAQRRVFQVADGVDGGRRPEQRGQRDEQQ